MIKGGRAKEAAAGGALPTTAYLMEGERCVRDCGFCPQARSAASRGDLLSRVNWPEVEGESGAGLEAETGGEAQETLEAFWQGLSRAAGEGRLRRACFQVTSGPGAREGVRERVKRLRRACPELPVCVSVAARNLAEVEEILGWGVERVSLALDAVTPELYEEIKGGSFEKRLALLEEAARRLPGRIGTHVIAGLGETEEEMVSVYQRMTDLGVTVALFAFTPIPGTRLAGRQPPELASYRRLQAALWLIRHGHARAEDMAFDGRGSLVSYGLSWERVAGLLAGGDAFRTSGCPDCNRPYYNERPSGALYNYPRPLTTAEAEETLATARRPSPWRLIMESRPRTGAENMAVDEAILTTHGEGGTPPTLRFYTWDRPAVSLGYFQDAAREVDREACREAGVSVVRRQTGGRAVLHEHEVTYSVVVSSDLLPGSVVETYRRLAEGLVLGLRELGYAAELAPEKTGPAGPGGPGGRAGACFEVPSSYEIVVGGRKVVGSAQTRGRGAILQHGSILLRLEPARLARLLGFPEEAASRIAAKAAGLEEFGEVPSYEEVCGAVSRGMAAALGITFVASELRPEETALAERLVREKYGLDGWNLKRPKTEKEEQ